jgi:hypothetical protein
MHGGLVGSSLPLIVPRGADGHVDRRRKFMTKTRARMPMREEAMVVKVIMIIARRPYRLIPSRIGFLSMILRVYPLPATAFTPTQSHLSHIFDMFSFDF